MVDNNSKNLKNCKILLVEDDELNRLLFTELIKIKGLQCDIEKNGEDAVNRTLKNDYDIIFMDCHMPIMDGYTATRIIRQNERGKKHTPIIAITANVSPSDIQKCISSGMDEYIGKPINLKQLENVIIKYLHYKSKSNNEYYNNSLNTLIDETGLDRDVAIELYEIGLPLIIENLNYIKNQILTENKIEIYQAIHKLKGSISTLRIDCIYELVRKGEKLVDEEKFDELNNLIDEINKTLNENLKI